MLRQSHVCFWFLGEVPRAKASAFGGRLLLRQKSAKPFAPDARRRFAPMPCAAGMARAGPNSRIHALEHADLCPAPCCAARRAFKARGKATAVVAQIRCSAWFRNAFADRNAALLTFCALKAAEHRSPTGEQAPIVRGPGMARVRRGACRARRAGYRAAAAVWRTWFW